jgi:diaminopimelate epimerase
VPHLVLLADAELFAAAASLWGPALRHPPGSDPSGANVTLVGRQGEEWAVRTFERGVEAETLSCGSGNVAAAHVLMRLGLARTAVTLRNPGGDRLRVREEGESWFLEGPARILYRGVVE